MAAAVLNRAAASPAFTASAIPTVIVDCGLRVVGANAAYEQVSRRTVDTLRGEDLLVAFPDNPRDPAGSGSARLVSSVERVLSRRQRDHMGFTRYDITDPANPDVYLRRVWSAVNSPIISEGRPVGMMEQVEDVTLLCDSPEGSSPDSDDVGGRLAVALSNATVTLAALEKETHHLRQGLATSRVIGMATGILMSRHRISKDQAFDLLRFRSQHSNQKLRDVAAYVADTGTLPNLNELRSR